MLRTVLLSLLLVTVACGSGGGEGSDDVTGPSGIGGTYTLAPLPGSPPLPELLYQEQGAKLELVGGSITVDTKALTYSARVQFRQTQGSTVTTPEWKSSGVMKGNGYSYSFYENPSAAATFEGNVTSTNVQIVVSMPKSVIDNPNVSDIHFLNFAKQ